MERSSVRESVKHFMNDIRQDLGTTTWSDELNITVKEIRFICLFVYYIYMYIAKTFIKTEPGRNRAVLWL